MKTTTKTLLVSAIAMACAGGVYAQGAGGSAGAGGGAGGGMRGGAAPSGNTLEQPGIQPGMNGGNSSTYDQDRTMRRHRKGTGGYGSPGTTGTGSGRSTVSPGTEQTHPSGTTDGSSPQQNDPTYRGGGKE